MITVINYANTPYRETQEYCTKSAYRRGKADKVIEYGPNDIDRDFYNKNSTILQNKRGGGLWLWKPYIICKALKEIQENDYLIYIDSGAYFIRSAKYLTDMIDSTGQDILCFELGNLFEKQYTKPDVFVRMGLNEDKYKDTCQRLATIIVCKKTGFTVSFFKEYLELAQNEEIIFDDNPERSKKECPAFVSHREDQSIYSLLTKKYQLKGYRNPSQWGVKRGLMNLFIQAVRRCGHETMDYPVVIIVHRCKKVNWKTKVKVFIQQCFPRTCNMLAHKFLTGN